MFKGTAPAGLLLILFALTACKKPADEPSYVGTWRGTVLMIVRAEFKFSEDDYVQKTYSFNDVMIGGTRGKLKAEGKDKLLIEQTHKYYFDNATNRGEWIVDKAKYTITYKITGKTIVLHPSTSDESMTLEKE